MDTVWVLGDQLNRGIGALAGLRPGDARILLVESQAKLASRPWHRQRAHFLLASMRRFARELEAAGFEVDHRIAPSFAAGVTAHRRRYAPGEVRVTEPNSLVGRRVAAELGCSPVRSNQFLCHHEDFAGWAAGAGARLRMEDFYRWQRRRLGYLLQGDEPEGGRWNLDHDNRQPPPREDAEAMARRWPAPPRSELDELDRAVLAELDAAEAAGAVSLTGAPPDGWWATSRRGALVRLRRFVADVLPAFGPHEDAMTTGSWHLAHSLLSPYLNNGLLLPGEVADAVEEAYRAGGVPLASAEGFVRQVIGWREYVWGLYWLWMPGYRQENALEAHRPLPPAFEGAPTRMRCVAEACSAVHDRGWAHHIQRLMVLGNLSLLAGVEPDEVTGWMWASFVDGAEWVMVPNVVGMALHADGGRMATKPYASGGAYINRMSDYCKGCTYDPRRRVGDDACPFTTLYWEFLARHRERFARNHRMAPAVRSLERLADLPAVRRRAAEVLTLLDTGDL